MGKVIARVITIKWGNPYHPERAPRGVILGSIELPGDAPMEEIKRQEKMLIEQVGSKPGDGYAVSHSFKTVERRWSQEAKASAREKRFSNKVNKRRNGQPYTPHLFEPELREAYAAKYPKHFTGENY